MPPTGSGSIAPNKKTRGKKGAYALEPQAVSGMDLPAEEPSAMRYEYEYTPTAARRRRTAWTLLLVGLVFLALYIESEYVGRVSFPSPPISPLVYAGLVVGCLMLQGFVWRCPRCGRTPGQLTAHVCAHCRLRLVPGSTADLSGRVDVRQVRRAFQRRLLTMRQAERFGWPVFLLGFLCGCGMFIYFNGIPGSFLDGGGMLLLGTVLGTVVRTGYHTLITFAVSGGVPPATALSP